MYLEDGTMIDSLYCYSRNWIAGLNHQPKEVKMSELFEMSDNGKTEECIGLLWRGKVSSWVSDGSIYSKTGLILSKRKSCRGCANCRWQRELVAEDIYSDNFGSNILADIEDGKLYRLHIYLTKDFESGYEEVDSYEFVEVDE